MITTISLDEETKQMLEDQARSLHISKSGFIRLLLVKNKIREDKDEERI
jgi:hypothetical protein